LSREPFESAARIKGTENSGKKERINTRDQPPSNGAGSSNDNNRPSIPSISLPKGGGAIRGLGEKFAANPVTGTGSLNVPIFMSPGRSGFGPQLSLSYDSGAGNGPFGFGWNLSLPSITRKTDKGLPRYEDDRESAQDVFILSGAEDLVPVLKKDKNNGNWIHDDKGNFVFDDKERDGYIIRSYRPRIEGLFARIERWTRRSDGDIHWRSISKDNILTVYGRDEKSRITDPADNKSSRIFSWLVCESYDDKGNAIVYEYAAENDKGIDLSQTNERNRLRTANRYIKRIWYGNRKPLLLDINKPDFHKSFRKSHVEEQIDFSSAKWMFEVVFDYGGQDHYIAVPLDSTRPESEQHQFVRASAKARSGNGGSGRWSSIIRPDPFSNYRAGFEVRTYRRCERVLMFHHFTELGGEPYLVRSTEFDYSDLDYGDNGTSQPQSAISVKTELEHKGSTRFASFIQTITQSGYVRDKSQSLYERDGIKYYTYLKKSLPPLEFEYSKAAIQEETKEIDKESLENLPYGLDGADYQWVDLEGEGLSGILTEQAEAWFYKPNQGGKFGPLEKVATKPSLADLSSGGSQQQLLDLAGDGKLDLVDLDGPVPGFYERTDDDKSWENFIPFASLPNISWKNPNLKFVDLTGDGHADVLVTEDEVLFTWYPSLAENGFGIAARTHQAFDEEKGPHLVFNDGTQSIYLADMSGDGLTDLVRIRNGQVCYWPNLGYGHFGAKVTMDNAPLFDAPDQFDQKRIRLADIDGSGVTDIIYLQHNAVEIYFNQSGNGWSSAYMLSNFPNIDNLSSLQVADLFGNGTTCMIWSSPLPGDSRRQMRFIDLMGGQKPHLLIKSINNLGAETHVHYTSSTKYYLSDRLLGKPWVTKLPFPVHVVERVETYDYISRNRFVTRYAYHHGYFDGVEREFRGFGMVEQWDTEEFATLSDNDSFAPTGAKNNNVALSSHVPPVLTKTWYHTGVYLGRDHVSNFFAGLVNEHDRGEYYREPGWLGDDKEARKHLLDDTVLPAGLTIEEERQACRALKGSMLRKEVYALDRSDKAQHPFTVTEQNFTIRMLQPYRRGSGNNNNDNDDVQYHAVFFIYSREVINYHYERNPTDPRISHALTLEVDNFGNVLKQVAVGYGRRKPDPELPLQVDRDKQTQQLITYTENRFTNAIHATNDYRAPLPCETSTYELTGYTPTGPERRFQHDDFVKSDRNNPDSLAHLFDSEINYEDQPTGGKQRRLIEKVRTVYRKNRLTALLSIGSLESLAIPGNSYKLAFTPGLLAQIYQRPRKGQPSENLLPYRVNVLSGQGRYLLTQDLKVAKVFPKLDPDDYWWIPAGQVRYSPSSGDSAAQELAYASQHFFLPRRYLDPFSQTATIRFDGYDLLMLETIDPAGNRITAGERLGNGQIDPSKLGNDYRVLQPRLLTDANRNRTEVAFDTLGMVVGTAVKGKIEDTDGDSLNGFEPDLTVAQVDSFYRVADPHAPVPSLLNEASTRIIYDPHCFYRTRQAHPEVPTRWLPVWTAALARETHVSDQLLPRHNLKIQIRLFYSDGLGHEIQEKIQAEPGPLVKGGRIVRPRWVGSGWTIFNNKGKPVRQYEPFFSSTHGFEFAHIVGVSPILFYDPVERVVAILHPNQTYEKVVFKSWEQMAYDVNDTVAAKGTETGDPRTDADIRGYVEGYFNMQRSTWKTWHQQRITGAEDVQERHAAEKAQKHANTPTIIYFDTLGRTFLTIAHNRFDSDRPDGKPVEERYATRVKLDIEGNQREVRDTVVQNGDREGRIITRYYYDMLGTQIHQQSIEAGEQWVLNDVMGKPIRMWKDPARKKADAMQAFEIEYDALRRPICSYVTGFDPADFTHRILFERIVYGEQHPQAEARNLRERVYLQCDGAGVVTSEQFDFKGNLEHTTRRLAKEYKHSIDWTSVNAAIPLDSKTAFTQNTLQAILSSLLENETFSSTTRYDAYNRPIQLIAPHSDKSGTKINVIQYIYNAANMLDKIYVWLERTGEPTALLNASIGTKYVSEIDYNAKGQREHIEYGMKDGNRVWTTYDYDEETFRLVHMQTRRKRQGRTKEELLQDLYYTYDPVGNIMHIHDGAQQALFVKGRRVEPSADYIYDALYRLIEATGREHLGLSNGSANHPEPTSPTDDPRVGLNLNNPNFLGSYYEKYTYDAVGNIVKLVHDVTEPSNPGWTRLYRYLEDSLIESTKRSNRLSSTKVRGITYPYKYDSHGNMTRMPHFDHSNPTKSNMHWDLKDRLQKVDLDGGGIAYYVYDSSGQRVRRIHEHNGALVEARIYLGNYEIYRKRIGSLLELVLERETLHIMDDERSVALVERRTINKRRIDRAPRQLIRYQCNNHLGSACLELDPEAKIISYEEYYPYGSTSYQAMGSEVEVAHKRLRYVNKERDEETGLYYYGARYYASWLGRWINCDPAGLVDGINLYNYSKNNPSTLYDPDGSQTYGSQQYLPFTIVGLENLVDPRNGEVSEPTPSELFATTKEEWKALWEHGKLPEEISAEEQEREAYEKEAPGTPAVGLFNYLIKTGLFLATLPQTLGSPEGIEKYNQMVDQSTIKLESRKATEGAQAFETMFVALDLALGLKALVTAGTSLLMRARSLVNLERAGIDLVAHTDDFVTSILKRAALSANERGPVLTGIMDIETSEISFGLNIGRKGAPVTSVEMEQLMESLHPLLRKRVQEQTFFSVLGKSGENSLMFEKAGAVGTHSEVIALNNALKAREMRLGRQLTEADLSGFLLHNRSLRGPNAGSLVPPRCVNCSSITRGVGEVH
jgi:RHS repeat-associated protein